MIGSSLYVFGKTDVLEVSLSNVARPRPVARLESGNTGRLNDLVGDGAHLYMVGNRGFQVTDPDGRRFDLPAGAGAAVIDTDKAGIYEIAAGQRTYSLAANVLYGEESDLSDCGSGYWGNWLKTDAHRRGYRSIAWVFLLAALGLLTVHAAMIATTTGGGRQ